MCPVSVPTILEAAGLPLPSKVECKEITRRHLVVSQLVPNPSAV